MSSIQVSKGLLGALIVEPKKGSESDPSTSEATALYQQLGSSMLVNGSVIGLSIPGKPGEQVRLRLINSGNETMEFGVDGAPFRVMAMDGHDLHEPGLLEGKIVPIGAGQRYDLLIQVPESGKVVVSSPSAKGLPVTIGSGSQPQHKEGGSCSRSSITAPHCLTTPSCKSNPIGTMSLSSAKLFSPSQLTGSPSMRFLR